MEIEGILTAAEYIYDMGEPVCGRCICGQVTVSGSADISGDVPELVGVLSE